MRASRVCLRALLAMTTRGNLTEQSVLPTRATAADGQLITQAKLVFRTRNIVLVQTRLVDRGAPMCRSILSIVAPDADFLDCAVASLGVGPKKSTWAKRVVAVSSVGQSAWYPWDRSFYLVGCRFGFRGRGTARAPTR
jgi:hypothetical protein